MTKSRIRILLVDAHRLVRAGLRMLIDSQAGMAVVGEAANRAEALALADHEQPDLILLDLDLGDESGLDLLPELCGHRHARVIVLTGVRDTEMHSAAVRLGAMGVVLKQQPPDVMVKAIEKVHAGQIWLDRALVASVLTSFSHEAVPSPIDPEQSKLRTLTERESQVIALICEGLQNKHIGQRLSISETTVRHYLTSIFDKLGVANRLELVIYAYRHQLERHVG